MITLMLMLLAASTVAQDSFERCKCTAPANYFKIREEITSDGDFTTVKAIYLRQALQDVSPNTRTLGIYVNRENLVISRSFKVIFDMLIFYSPADANTYKNLLNETYLRDRTHLPITLLNQTLIPYIECH